MNHLSDASSFYAVSAFQVVKNRRNAACKRNNTLNIAKKDKCISQLIFDVFFVYVIYLVNPTVFHCDLITPSIINSNFSSPWLPMFKMFVLFESKSYIKCDFGWKGIFPPTYPSAYVVHGEIKSAYIVHCPNQKLLKPECNNVVGATLFLVVNNIVRHFYKWLRADSGLTILFNIVDNQEQYCAQQHRYKS